MCRTQPCSFTVHCLQLFSNSQQQNKCDVTDRMAYKARSPQYLDIYGKSLLIPHLYVPPVSPGMYFNILFLFPPSYPNIIIAYVRESPHKASLQSIPAFMFLAMHSHLQFLSRHSTPMLGQDPITSFLPKMPFQVFNQKEKKNTLKLKTELNI